MVNYFIKYLQVNLKGMSEFRFSFFFDTITLLFVNLAFYGSVIYLAYANNGLGGLSYYEVLSGVTIMELAYIIGLGFFKGTLNFNNKIINGELDSILTRPVNAYFHIMIQRFDFKNIGEIASLIVLFFLNKPSNIPFIIIFSFLSAIIFNLSAAIYGCLPFFVKLNSEINFFDIIIGFSNYPPGIFNNFMKFLGLFIFPGCMVGFGPILMLKNPLFSFVYFGFIATLIIAFSLVFNLGLKRYESAGY